MISPDVARDPVTRRRLTLAARGAVSVRSPHVARVFLYGEDNTRRLYIASELVAEGSLGQVLDSRGAAPVRAGLDLMAQLATGPAAAHARGLVHGALTPANVLLQWREGRSVGLLADVGTGWTATAPEVHLGSEPSVATDIHSMGALLWETLTGQPVHHGTPFRVAESYIKDSPPQLQGHSPQVRHLNQLLARADAPRPSSPPRLGAGAARRPADRPVAPRRDGTAAAGAVPTIAAQRAHRGPDVLLRAGADVGRPRGRRDVADDVLLRPQRVCRAAGTSRSPLRGQPGRGLADGVACGVGHGAEPEAGIDGRLRVVRHHPVVLRPRQPQRDRVLAGPGAGRRASRGTPSRPG
ncbi:protein kinase [Nocardioides sp. B-3]|uniref:protein kinase n=1 Tax=Nocardioides sp. B-3 TaxID=2895565 RepID=UPI00215379F3|nr:protein kinase [Nocardioides sp. B-3]UUZ61302.1 protein kinase [Nocardioides sp. B-3]